MLMKGENNYDLNRSFEERYNTLQAVFDTSDISFVMDCNDIILEANKAFAAMVHKSQQECININAFDLLPPELAASRREKTDEAFRTGNIISFEDENEGQFIHSTITPIVSSKNTITSLHISARDITELKLAQQESQNQKIFSSALIDAIPGAFYMINAEGRFIQWNAYERDIVVGKPEDEMANFFVIETIYPDDRLMVTEKIRDILEHGIEDSVEVRILMHGGPEVRWYYSTGKRIIINGEKFFIGTGIDITERKKTDVAAFIQSEERFRTLFEGHAAVHLIIESETGNIIDANQAAADFYGWPIAVLRTMKMGDINTIPQEQASLEIEKNRLAGNLRVPFQHRRADGSLRDIEAVTTRLNINGTDFSYAIINDVTERNLAETALQKMTETLIAAKEKAEENDRLKSAFLANISHEIRTPMNGILGFSELLKEPQLSGEEQTEYIGLMQRSGQRMLNLINDLIDISRIEAGETMVHIAETTVNELLRDIFTFFKPQAEAKGLQLKCTAGLSDSESIIVSDKSKIHQILTNLVQNALKFTRTGSITLDYTREGTMLMFSVSDTGIGIPLTMQNRIFDRFLQLNNSLTRAHEGSGLGLSISKAYVGMLGGTIRVESEEGKGSTFIFTIPYNPLNTRTAEPSLPPGEQVTVTPLSSTTILIAEDDEVSTMLLERTMKGENMTFLHAGNGLEAVGIVKDHPEIDLVLMDIKMPVMNGYEATRQIKQIRPGLPVISQTAFTSKENRVKAEEAGCDSFITKPINKNELLGLLKELLHR